MFFFGSMYFSFPRGQDAPMKCFGDEKHVWILPVMKATADYCFMLFLSKFDGIQTFVWI